MRYAGLRERIAGSRKTVSAIERDCTGLGMQEYLLHATVGSDMQQFGQYQAAQALSPVAGQDGHAPDLAGLKQAAGRAGYGSSRAGQYMYGTGIQTIPFQFFRDMLFFDEYPAADIAYDRLVT